MMRLPHRFAVGILLTLIACSQDSGEDEFGAAAEVKEAKSLEALEVSYAQYIDDFSPNTPQAVEALGVFLAAVESDPEYADQDPRVVVLERHRDSSMAIHLFREIYDEQALDSPIAAFKFSRTTRKTGGGSSLAAYALDRELAYLADHDQEEYLALLNEMSAKADPNRLARVALYRKAQFFESEREHGKAAVSYLRLWSRFPETVDKMGIGTRISGATSRAGYPLEARALELTDRPEIFSIYLLESWTRAARPTEAPRPDFPAADTEDEPDRPTVAEVEQAPTHVLADARSGWAKLQVSDASAAREHYKDFADGLKERLSAREIGFNEAVALEAVCRAITEGLKSAEIVDRATSRGADRGRGRQDVRPKLRSLEIDLRRLRVELSKQEGIDAYVAEIEGLVEMQRERGSKLGVIQSYRLVAEQFPESPQAPEYLVKVAELYEKELNAPATAIPILTQVIDQYPHSRQAATAGLKRGMLLYETKRFAESIQAFEEFIAIYPDSPQLPLARFFIALGEASSGMEAEGEAHMSALVDDNPDSSLAARALFWVGTNRLARQDYSGARTAFDDLVADYPDSKQATRAQSYLKKLAALDN